MTSCTDTEDTSTAPELDLYTRPEHWDIEAWMVPRWVIPDT